MSEQNKIRIVTCPPMGSCNNPLGEWEQKMSALKDAGYRLVTIDGNRAFLEYGGNDYSNVSNVKDVPPDEVDEYIAGGWEPGSLSLSTKFVRMVKRK